MKTMTRKQLFKVMSMHDYMAVRWSDGSLTGVNCKIALQGAKRFLVDHTRTNILGYYSISFQEYIRIKTPVKSK